MGEVTERTYNRARVVGYLGTGGTGLILFLILFYTYLVTPIPPYPEGGGGKGMEVEVNLGYADEGFGNVQQADLALPDFNEEVIKQVAPAEQPKEEVISQDNEETATVTTPPKVKKKVTPKATPPVPEKTVKKKEPAPVVEKPRVANKTALYKPGQTGTQTSQGVTKGSGDQGDPNGSQSSAIYGKGGNGGEGTGGGSGGGTGNGQGTGVGNGVGPGISFNLDGRSIIVTAQPDFTVQKEGIVVVEITVDKTGKVVAAKPGAKGSTIVDNTLYAAAKKAALQSKFNLKDDAPDLQVGKLTYHFKLK